MSWNSRWNLFPSFFCVFLFPQAQKEPQCCLRGFPTWYYLRMMPHLFLLLLKTCRSVLTNTACTLLSAVLGGSWADCLGATSVSCPGYSILLLGWQPVVQHICEIWGLPGSKQCCIIPCPNYLRKGTDGDTWAKKYLFWSYVQLLDL